MTGSIDRAAAPLLDIKNLVTHFRIGGRRLLGEAPKVVHAVDGVSFTVETGEVLGLVGESGCGKSTIGRTLTRLDRATSGHALFRGQDILALPPRRFTPLRRQIQMIFQDPYASLNPRMSVGTILAEPLYVHGLVKSRDEARAKVEEMLEQVGLNASAADRHPHAFSGGQRQRIGIGRAMILRPELVIADEPVSALDVSIQAQVLNLIKDLQKATGIAMLFISHDLGVVRHVSDRIAVMYLGRIVEIGPRERIFRKPAHPYTRLLLRSIPRPDPARPTSRPERFGEPPSPVSPPPGCRFHPRCPRATEKCRTESPALESLSDGHFSACHFAQEVVNEDISK